jgi:type II secretory pathway pseudopilin PulG
MAIVVILGIVVCIGFVSNISKARRLREAKEAYQSALATLSSHPGDNNTRIAALEAGRHYSDLARKAAGGGKRAVFDEVTKICPVCPSVGRESSATVHILPT